MNTCSTCAYWTPPDEESFSSQPEYGRCMLAQSHDGSPDAEGAMAFASDHECYQASLETKPGFGCNQWRLL